MPVCISEPRPGGRIRCEWKMPNGGGFHLTGEYLELEPYNRIVHVERMFLPDPTPDNHVETRFEEEGQGTLMTMRMTLPDAETRANMLATGMEHGMEASYARLDKLAILENANAVHRHRQCTALIPIYRHRASASEAIQHLRNWTAASLTLPCANASRLSQAMMRTRLSSWSCRPARPS